MININKTEISITRGDSAYINFSIYDNSGNVANISPNDVTAAIEEAISRIGGISYHVCTSGEYNPATFVPTISGEAGTIYLVPKNTSGTNNIYYEYIYNNSSYEKIGDTEIDLSDYLNTSDVASTQDVTDMLDEVYERS